ncbi:hypothetical protein SAMN02927895_00521 [Belnapia rosea]|nr:hypothetical protein SAMN02927895_00521 [Belnapia rosea]
MRFLIILATAFVLSGCSHRLTLQARDGSGGVGTASRGAGSGSIEVTLNGKRYEGRWTAATEGSVGFGTLLAGRRAASGSVISAGGSSGMALLRSADGGALRCEFIYSGMSGAGYGACEDGEGRRYDLLIG